ncbi:MAG: GntR family transcriptional regulator [Chloroflexota bacterium]
MTVLDRSSPIPLYFQLKNILLEKIEQAEWEAGELIPSEQELQDTYGLSRTTVRQTLSELVNEGRLNRHRGRGTFVSPPQMTHNPVQRLGATEYLAQQGIKTGWQLISADWAEPPEGVRERLQLGKQAQVYRIHRLRLANEETIGYHYAYLPEFIVSHVNKAQLTTGGSLRYLRDAPQMADSLAHRTIEATVAASAEVAQLGAQMGDPILAIERLIVAADGTPLELLWAAYRGDRFKYQITI